MKRKGILLVVLLFSVFVLASCDKKGEGTKEVIKVEPEQVESILAESDTVKEVEEVKEDVNIAIYFGNASADGLETQEVAIKELTPEKILAQLAVKNIVSVDTKVKGFQEVDSNGKKIVDLNLSKEFRQYVGMMGTSGEYIVIASLTNTFLDAYDADELILSVGGVPLATGHQVYDKPLTLYPMTEDNLVLSYELEEEMVQDDVHNFKYPQFVGMSDTAFMEKWNKIIKEQATGDYTEDGLLSYEVDYEIVTKDVDLVSIVFRGYVSYENAAHPFHFAKTLNIDLKTGNNKRLSSFASIDQIVKDLEEGKYTILSEGVTDDDIKYFLESGYVTDLAILLFDYDFDDMNRSLIPTGYSYIKDNKPVLVINVMHAMGDYVELQMDTIVSL